MNSILNAVLDSAQYLIAFLIVFTVIVLSHELGHFLAGKLMGIRVEVFSLGFGRRLFGFRRGHTDYRVSLLLMGGYVKFLGEGLFEPGRPLEPDDFMAKKRWQRFIVIAAGALMNILLAFVLLAGINMAGVRVPRYKEQAPVIGWIEPGSPAERAGLQPEDTLLRISGRKLSTWTDVELAIGTQPEKEVAVDILRGSREMTVRLKTEKWTRYEMGYAGFFGKILTEIQSVVPGSPAEKGGLQAGDLILSIKGRPVYFYSFIEAVESSPDRPLALEVVREGRTVRLSVTPRREGQVGKLGVLQSAESVEKKYAFFPALGRSVQDNLRLTTLVVRFLVSLVKGEISTEQLGGPIAIARISRETLRLGLGALISWIAFFSLQLGIINLIPIPVLDGGQLFVLTLEGILRRDFSPKLRKIWLQVGFFIFVFIIGFVILNDIVKFLPRGWGSLWPF
ncbi:MAG: RIP metalloprotease RseP [Candidatus Aminicenantes bacterium RBG_13_63_10]|nr:MAG: RIP metalloprotease RseP [Candidatus Aminicenantes bacterium RBG_13_63_10]